MMITILLFWKNIAQYIDWNNNRTSITFHCVFSHSCGALIGGCTVTLTRQTVGRSINQTEAVAGGSKVVEVSFNNLNFSESYNYSASFVRQDLVTRTRRSFSGIIPAMTFDNSSYSSTSVHSTQGVMYTISRSSTVSMATSLPGTRLTSSIIKPMQSSTSTGSFACLSNNYYCNRSIYCTLIEQSA